MLRIFTLAIGLMLLAGSVNSADHKPQPKEIKGPTTLAVFPLETRGANLERAERDILSDSLCQKLEQDMVFRVVGPRKLKKTLVEKLLDKAAECLDRLCRVNLAREVGANLILESRVSRIGSKCVVHGTIWDAIRMVTTHSAAAHATCKREDLLRAIHRVGVDLSTQHKKCLAQNGK